MFLKYFNIFKNDKILYLYVNNNNNVNKIPNHMQSSKGCI